MTHTHDETRIGRAYRVMHEREENQARLRAVGAFARTAFIAIVLAVLATIVYDLGARSAATAEQARSSYCGAC